MRLLGLDEAGRGCVLGPLVVGAFLWETDADPADLALPAAQAPLRAAGADDSKRLSPARRLSARAALTALGEGFVVPIPAARIDEGNVNTLEEEAFLHCVARARPDRVYLDAPVHPGGIPALRARLVRRSGVRDWVIEPKADGTWPVVGAASLWAKTERDAALAAIEATVPPPGLGSGYPSDPLTRAFLADLIRRDAPLPDWVRSRWATLDHLRQQALFPSPGPRAGDA